MEESLSLLLLDIKTTPLQAVVIVMVVGFGDGGAGENQIHTCVGGGVVGPLGVR